MIIKKYIIALTILFSAVSAVAKDDPPGVIKHFCADHFNQGIAAKGESFNATDNIKRGLPSRRIIDYFVTSTTSFLWYEHGGRGYHQHLVQFKTIRPEEIQASYVFLESRHSRIDALIKDTEFLLRHESKDGEL